MSESEVESPFAVLDTVGEETGDSTEATPAEVTTEEAPAEEARPESEGEEKKAEETAKPETEPATKDGEKKAEAEAKSASASVACRWPITVCRVRTLSPSRCCR